jgi:flagellar hook protein FlgE
LRSHQTRMDVIGNNIANVNTVGFKGSRSTFQEIFSQTYEGASSPISTPAVAVPTPCRWALASMSTPSICR